MISLFKHLFNIDITIPIINIPKPHSTIASPNTNILAIQLTMSIIIILSLQFLGAHARDCYAEQFVMLDNS